ncbi:MAG TPA: fatty acid--CoA ligase family protein, partial [Labilithrix sp.]|nr:fatty acid--CoA ligase family protein [Labilithrix sp.]
GHAMLAQLDNVPAVLVALLASARVRATFAPIDIGATDAEIEGIAELTRSDLIIGAASEAARSERLFRNVVSLDAAGSVMSVRAPSLSAPSIAPNIGCMQFSSGTTGASKGILLSHEAFFYRSHYLMRSLGLTDADRTLCALPLSHPHGSECLALPTLMAGGSLYVKSPKFSFPLYILEELAKHRITFFSSIPQFYDFAVKLGLGTPPDLSALRLPFCGSAALSQVTAENFRTKYGVHIRQGYGLAELAVICINHHDTGNIVYDSVGKPIEGIEWQLVGGDSESEGELVVRSKAMFSGYINDEEATRAKLRDGWLYTGDVVSIDADGRFRIVGRKEDFIKVNGFKVYAAEVEKAIVGLPWIKECAVVSEKDALGTERIVAHIVPTDSTRSSEEMHALLIRDLRMTLSEHKLPKRCVAWPELPKNPLGKILKSQIAAVSTTK